MDILERRGVERIPGRHWISDYEERNSLKNRISRAKDQERAGPEMKGRSREVQDFPFVVQRASDGTRTTALDFESPQIDEHGSVGSDVVLKNFPPEDGKAKQLTFARWVEVFTAEEKRKEQKEASVAAVFFFLLLLLLLLLLGLWCRPL